MDKEVSWDAHQSLKRMERRVTFLQELQDLTNQIHALERIDDTMLDLSRDICALFGCDRLTLYMVSACRTQIESKIKTGMTAFKDFMLPIAASSIAGYAALTKRVFNIRDVYDASELRVHSSELRFFDKADKKTCYRTREMVVAPIVNARTGELLGVLQLINNRLGGPFSTLIEEGAQELCKTLAVAFERRIDAPLTVQTRFDPLVVLGALSTAELELAKRTARRKQFDLEEVLIDEFQVTPEDLGAAYAYFFSVPYAPFRSDRATPALLQHLKREYVEHNGWLVLEESGKTVIVAAIDPGQLRASHIVDDLLPGYDVQLHVTTRREFLRAVEQRFSSATTASTAGNADKALLERLHRILDDALASAAPKLQAAVQSDFSQVDRIDGATGGHAMHDGLVTVRIALKLP